MLWHMYSLLMHQAYHVSIDEDKASDRMFLASGTKSNSELFLTKVLASWIGYINSISESDQASA